MLPKRLMASPRAKQQFGNLMIPSHADSGYSTELSDLRKEQLP